MLGGYRQARPITFFDLQGNRTQNGQISDFRGIRARYKNAVYGFGATQLQSLLVPKHIYSDTAIQHNIQLDFD
jgi:hypothetical protein